MTTKQSLNIYQRVQAVMRDVSYIKKEKKQGLQYAVVLADDVAAKLHPKCVEHGIVVVSHLTKWEHDGNMVKADVQVDLVNVDNPGDRICVPSLGFGIDKQDKGPGKALTYATKMVLLKIFMLESGDDPDRDNIDYRGGGDDCINATELKEVRAMIKRTESSEQDLLKWARVPALEQLPKGKYLAAMRTLKARLTVAE